MTAEERRWADGRAGGGGNGMDAAEIDEVADHVARGLTAFPEVAGAYLYGSVLGQMHGGSDIDVAVVAVTELQKRLLDVLALEAKIQRRLGSWKGHPFHVTVLDPAQPFFSFRPLHDGRLVYIGNDRELTDFIERVARAYADLAPRHRRALHEVLTS